MRTTGFGDESAAKPSQCVVVSDLNVIGLDPVCGASTMCANL